MGDMRGGASKSDGAIDAPVRALARALWDYHRLGQPLKRCDGMLVLGSHDLRVAECAADLYHEGWAPWVVMSGGLGNLTRGLWTEPEAEKFARIARTRGVPDARLLLETRSTNTGENLRFSRALLAARGMHPGTCLLVQKPTMERRAVATFLRVWPGAEAIAASPRIAFDDYPTEAIPLARLIAIMVGDLQRILVYPERGFQVAQDVPESVMAAYEELIARGFTDHMLP